MRRDILLVGTGEIARRVHLPVLVASSNVGHVAVTDTDRRMAEAAAAQWGVDIHRGPLEESSADMVVVCTPPATHASLALRALHAGKDVVVEKPLATSGADAREVRRTADRLGRALHVCHTPAYRRDVIAVLNLVRSGALGTVEDVDVSWTRNSGMPGTVGGLSAGVIWDLGAHVTHLAVACATSSQVSSGWTVSALAHRPVVPEDALASWYDPSTRTAPPATAHHPVMAAFEGTALLEEGHVLRVRAGWHGAGGDDLVTARVRGSRGAIHLRTLFGFSPARTRLRGPAVLLENLRTGTRRPLMRSQMRRPGEYAAQWNAFWLGSDEVALSTAVSTVELCEGFERAARTASAVTGLTAETAPAGTDCALVVEA